MMKILSEEDVCLTCQQTRGWHEMNRTVHPFNNGQPGATNMFRSSDRRKTPEVTTVRRGEYPIDPVLRTALINKGVITPQDLRDAEELIQATTARFEATVRESRDGESPT